MKLAWLVRRDGDAEGGAKAAVDGVRSGGPLTWAPGVLETDVAFSSITDAGAKAADASLMAPDSSTT